MLFATKMDWTVKGPLHYAVNFTIIYFCCFSRTFKRLRGQASGSMQIILLVTIKQDKEVCKIILLEG